MAMPNISVVVASNDPTGASNNAKVKQEPHDEAEIRELAAKISEANKAKMAAAQAVQNARAANAANAQGQGIASYFPKVGAPNANKASPATAVTSAEASAVTVKKVESVPVDEASRKGQFGWTTLGKADLPYILRNGEKYVAVRMVETKLLDVYLNYLHRDIYSCTSIPSYYVTDIESKLLRDVNERHCDFYFGKEPFTVKDLVVKLDDAKEFYTFLDFCYHKLTNKPNPNSAVKDKCGFIRINGESVVPFTVKGEQKFVPLFYFEGETDNLKLKSEKLENWDLAYLKFCCKVQGIRNELFASETCSVISLTNIKSYFPTGTTFEAYWPTKVVDSQLIVSAQRPNNIAGSSWIKAPPGGVPVIPGSVTSVMQRLPSGQQVPVNGWNPAQGPAPYQAAQVARMSQPVIHQQIGGLVGSDRNFATGPVRPAARSHPAQANQYYATLQHPQAANPALTRVVVPTAAGGATYVTANHSNPYQMQYAMQNMQKSVPNANASQLVSNPKYPPPLIPVNGNSGNPGGGGSDAGSQRYANYPNARTNPEIIDLSAQQQAPSQSQRNAYLKANGNPGNGHVISRVLQESGPFKKLIPISEYQQESANHYPYKLQKAFVNGTMVQSINAKPYVYDELLITLGDLVISFFPRVPVSKLREVLQDVLKINLFKGNRLQHHVLLEHNKCKPNEIVPLVQLKDIVQYMPQLNYMFSRSGNIDEPTSKRQRTS